TPADQVDHNTSNSFMNKAAGFLTLQQVFLNYEPIKDRGVLSTPGDANTNGTKQLYFSQQWGKHLIFVNTDARSYRDIRLKLNDGRTDDTTFPRADDLGRTMLGTTQLAWLEQTLLDAQAAGTTWKIVTSSDPIDQIGPIGGTLNNVFNAGGPSYSPVRADGG